MPKPRTSKSPNSDIASSPSEAMHSDITARITNYIRAGYPGLYLVSHEEQRVDGEMKAVALELNYTLHFWSVVDGLIDSQTGQSRSANDPLEALAAIWAIQIRNYGRDPRDFDLVQLSRAAEGLTGSEIEQVFVEALYLAFDSGGEAGEKEPTDLDIAGVLNEFVPLSKLMTEQIAGLRQWAKGRARPATSTHLDKQLRKMMV